MSYLWKTVKPRSYEALYPLYTSRCGKFVSCHAMPSGRYASSNISPLQSSPRTCVRRLLVSQVQYWLKCFACGAGPTRNRTVRTHTTLRARRQWGGARWRQHTGRHAAAQRQSALQEDRGECVWVVHVTRQISLTERWIRLMFEEVKGPAIPRAFALSKAVNVRRDMLCIAHWNVL
jgi:hypothetical protein